MKKKSLALGIASLSTLAVVGAGLSATAHAKDAPAPTAAQTAEPTEAIIPDADLAGIKAALDKASQKYTVTTTTEEGEQVNTMTLAGGEAGIDAINDYYWNQAPMSAEEIRQASAEAKQIVDLLKSKGLEATLATDKHGLTTAEFDQDDEKINQVIADYFAAQTGGAEVAGS